MLSPFGTRTIAPELTKVNQDDPMQKPQTGRARLQAFLDLDGVLADLHRLANCAYGVAGSNIPIGQFSYAPANLFRLAGFWLWLRRHPEAWASLEKTTECDLLLSSVNALRPEKVTILTALPRLLYPQNSLAFMHAADQKLLWCKKHVFAQLNCPTDFICCHARLKKIHAAGTSGETRILVDDKPSNAEDWIVSGGQAFLYSAGNADKLAQWASGITKSKTPL